MTIKLQVLDKKYMYDKVIKDFDTKDGKWLIEQYGAAVLMGMDIGGQWSDNMVVSKLYQNSISDVSLAMNAAYASFLSGEGSTTIKKALETEKSIMSRQVQVTGGDPRFPPNSIEEWQASVKDSPALVNFTSDGLVWIWDLFEEHADKLKKGFDEYIAEKSLKYEKKMLIQCQAVEGYKYSSDAGSGAKRNLDLYKPTTSASQKYVGVNGNSNAAIVVSEILPKYGALAPPTGWQQVWNDRGSGEHLDYSCWLPIPPPNYVALGVYCRFRVNGHYPPTPEEVEGFVVVHQSFVKVCFDFKDADVWNDHGTGADFNLTLVRLPHDALWPITNDPIGGILPTKYTFNI